VKSGLTAMCLGLALGWAPAAAEEPVVVKVGITNVVADVGFYVADKRGYFAAENLKVDLVSFDAAAKMIAPLASGDLDVGGGGVSAGLFNAVARGVGLRIVADKSSSYLGVGTGALMVRKDLVESGRYKTPLDLKGAKLALPAAGTATSTSLQRFFSKFGMSLHDMDLVYLSFPQMVGAMRNKAIEAAFMTEPSVTTATRSGDAARVVGDDEMFPNHQIAVTLFSERFINARRDVAVRFMRAFLRGVRDYASTVKDGRLSGPGSEDMIAILTQYSLVKDPAVYRGITVHGCDPDGKLNLDSLQIDFDYFKSEGLIEGKVAVVDAIDASIAAEAVRDLGPYKPM